MGLKRFKVVEMHADASAPSARIQGCAAVWDGLFTC